jgi:hypothetical protein
MFGKISATGINSTNTALGGDATFQGISEDVSSYSQATVTLVGTTSSATGTLYFEKSIDGDVWESVPRTVTDITATLPFTFLLTAPFFRSKYVNGSTAQTTFRLLTKFANGSPGSISVNDSNTFTKTVDAQLVQTINQHNLDVVRGKFTYQSTVNKFGANAAIGTSYEPVSTNGIYKTPQVSGAVALRVAAGAAQNTSAGTGARTITLQGLDETGALVSETVSTNGTSAGTASTTTFLRLFRIFVVTSGTYATQSAGSHVASTDIVIEDASNNEWGRIDASNGFPIGQSQIGAYSVPLGYEAYLTDYALTVNGTKAVDFVFFQRQDILQTSAPYSAMRAVINLYGIDNDVSFSPNYPVGPFPALTDIGWMAKSSTTSQVSVDFEIVLMAT